MAEQITKYGIGDVDMNDQAASGYFDIGTMRIVWGRVASTTDGDQVVVFPATFSVAPVVMSSMERDANAGYGAVDNVTTSQFKFNRLDTINNEDNPFIHYFAIGLKP